MKRMTVFLVALLSTISASRADIEEQRRWLRGVLSAETMIVAAVETADGEELRRQSLELMKLIGKSEGILGDLRDFDKLNCVMAASNLANYASSLRTFEPARALVSARADAALYAKSLPACAKALGLKARSRLPT